MLIAVLPIAIYSLTGDEQLRYQMLADVMPFWAWIVTIWESAEFVFARALHVLLIAGASAAIFGNSFLRRAAKKAHAEAIARTFD